MSKFYKLSEAKAENFCAPNKPNKRNWKKEGSSGDFLALDVRYKDPSSGIIAEAFFELMGEGVLRKDKYGKITLTIRIKEAADKAGAEECNKGIMKNCIAAHKQDLAMNHFDPERPGDVRGVYFYDTANGSNPVDGVEPKIYLRLDSSSRFQIPVMKDGQRQGQQIPFQNLIDKKFFGSIIFTPRDIYRANGAITRSYVRCFTILEEPKDAGYIDVFGKGDGSPKSDMIAKFLEQADPKMYAALLASAEKLEKESKSLLSSAPVVTTTTTTVQAPSPSLNIPTMSSVPQQFLQQPQQFQQQPQQFQQQPQQITYQQAPQQPQQQGQQYQTVPPTPSSQGMSQGGMPQQYQQMAAPGANMPGMPQGLQNFFGAGPGMTPITKI